MGFIGSFRVQTQTFKKAIHFNRSNQNLTSKNYVGLIMSQIGIAFTL